MMRVAIADDSLLIREGLGSLLAGAGLEVVAKVANGDDLLAVIPDAMPEVAMIDVRMPPTFTDEGIRAADMIDKSHPQLGVVILSHYIEAGYAMRLLERRTAGRGYLLKDQLPDIEMIVTAVKTVGSGGSFLDPAVVKPLLERDHVPDALAELTARERELLALMAEGRSNSAICAQLYLSPKTVEGYVRSIFMKLDLPPAADDHRRVLAVLRYLRA
jgi:DNA-binding NarL/FixJ family response regulator